MLEQKTIEGKLFDFFKIKQSVPLEQVIRHYKLMGTIKPHKNIANRYEGTCPLCGTVKGKPFKVDLKNNRWNCFSCRCGGNVLDFVREKERTGIIGAATALCSWFSVDAETTREEIKLKKQTS